MNLVKWVAIIILMAAVILAASTAYKPANEVTLSNVEAVEIRSRDWLLAMIESDWEATYEFTSPGYKSGVRLLDHMLKMAARRVSWVGGEILSSECDDSVCKVNMRIVYKVFSPMRGLREFESFETVTNNWVKADNQWWLVPK